jgi:hypothetical protein
MSRDKVQEPLEGIDEVQGRLAQWRQGRVPGQPMPQELWAEAVALAERHGVYAVARSLGLEFAKLKRLLEERSAPRLEANERGPKAGRSRRRCVSVQQVEASGFVEVEASGLFGQNAHGVDSAVVELFAADGARMRISLSGRAALDLPGLVSAFARRG